MLNSRARAFRGQKLILFPVQTPASAVSPTRFILIVTELKNLYTTIFGVLRAREDLLWDGSELINYSEQTKKPGSEHVGNGQKASLQETSLTLVVI